MAISRMQEPQQVQSGIGSLKDPRQGYFLGKLVKKATRGIKKIVKSPIGKLALLGAGAYGLGALGAAGKGGFFKQLMAGQGNFGLPQIMKGAGKLFLGSDGGVFGGGGGLLGKAGEFSGKRAFLTGGALATALPLFMGGGEDEVEEEVDVMDPRYQVQRAKNFYSGAGDAGAGLDFMPKKKYVMQNFYAADGGRAGYANGMMVEEDDDEEEFIRSRAGQSFRQRKAFLNMGGGAGQAQAEQMLMMEYVKYKNKGGTLSFEQFVKAVMQEAAPEGAGMEQPQPVMMAADGGRIGKQEGGIMETEVSEEIMPLLDMDGKEKDYRNTGGFVDLGRKERADDVPARLSKNEFVFTADAVRNAGGGDIDKGAEVMENLMKNLEEGGEISEESQGLEGAQAMYEQQQMLQSRII